MLSFLATSLLLIGVASGNSLSRIIGGTDSTLAEHPHQVSLRSSSGSHICGASIINSQWVLTAAHCVDSSNSYSISLNDGRLTGARNVYSVDVIVKHEDYNVPNAGAYPNDVALLKLNGEMDFSLGHKPISLAASNQNFDGAACKISGWGNTKLNGPTSIPNTLQETYGNILTSSQCASRWGSNYNHAVHICIDEPNSGSCNGDSGGPMVCNGVLAGVTSWGYSGCRTDFPSVYARVSTFRGWIDTTMNKY